MKKLILIFAFIPTLIFAQSRSQVQSTLNTNIATNSIHKITGDSLNHALTLLNNACMNKISDSVFQKVVIHLDSLKLRLLHGTPIVILPYSGNGNYYEIKSVFGNWTVGSKAYTGSDSLYIYDDSFIVPADENNNIFSDNQIKIIHSVSSAFMQFGKSYKSRLTAINGQVKIYCKYANPTVGNGYLDLIIWYRKLAL